MRCAWEPCNVWNDRNDFTFQTVEELFQFALVSRHSQISKRWTRYFVDISNSFPIQMMFWTLPPLREQRVQTE